jgi:2-iminobutanoate/2-iminopropanoate deaminase
MHDSSPPSKAYGPYTPIRQVGDLYFTAGHVGVDSATGKADPDIRVQVNMAIANIQNTLGGAGLLLDDVVKVTLFVTDMAQFGAVNEEYVKHFSEPRPARSTVGVKELPRVGGDVQIKVEIEAVAARPREAE